MGMLQRKRNNRRSAARARRFTLPVLPWRRIGLSLVGIAVIALALSGLALLLNQPISRVIVSGRLQRVSALDVEKIVRSRLGGNGLVTVDLEDISDGMRTLPWVDRAAPHRRSPHGLRIGILGPTPV